MAFHIFNEDINKLSGKTSVINTTSLAIYFNMVQSIAAQKNGQPEINCDKSKLWFFL